MKRLAPLAGATLLATAPGFVDPPYRVLSGEAHADAALVLSGDVDYLRVRRAAALHSAGAIGALVFTGAGVGGDSAAVLAAQAHALGVPEEAMVQEERSGSTRENILVARRLIADRQWERIALVTSASHMGRALRTARTAAPEVRWVPVPVRDAGPPMRVYRTRYAEWVKLMGYALRGWLWR